MSGRLGRDWFITEVDDGGVADVDRGVNGLQEHSPEGSATVVSPLKGLRCPIRVDRELGVHCNEMAPMGTQPSGPGRLRHLAYDGGIPPPAVVALELGGCVN